MIMSEHMKPITASLMGRNIFSGVHHSNGKMEVICAQSTLSRFNPARLGYTIWMAAMK